MALVHKTNRVSLYLQVSAAATSFVCLSESIAALPPATLGEGEGRVVEVGPQTSGAEPEVAVRFVDFAMEPIHLGGTLSYDFRYDSGDGTSSKQQGITTTLDARTGVRGYLWHPALSDFAGSLGLSMQRANSSGNNSTNDVTSTNNSNSKGITIVGNGKLSVLPYSRVPFEVHIDRSDTRSSSNLSAADGYTNQRYGFSQRYTDPKLSSSLMWDRNTQFNEKYGESQQDNLSLSITPVLSATQNLNLTGSSAHNYQNSTGEHTKQDNLGALHRYAPSPDISIDSSVNLSHSGYRLAQGENNTQLVQLSSLVFWHSKEHPLTMTGGVRLLALTNEGANNNSDGSAFTFRSRNTNFNIGANYDFSKYTRLSATGNLNLIGDNSVRSNSSNESLGLTYTPDSVAFNKYIYNWSTSANATSTEAQGASSKQLSLQLSHGLSRMMDMGNGALNMNATQSISSVFSNNAESEKRMTHTGSLSWSHSQEALLSLTLSDSRTLGRGDAFQMINFQASSNLPTGPYTSWTGSLTIQAVRQRSAAPLAGNNEAQGSWNFTTTSSGSINYQNQRAFGIPRLRYVSDIRLNSQALLPILSGPDERATSSWDNSLDYGIGRTQLRLNTRLSKVAGKTNKSILFTAIRVFGNS